MRILITTLPGAGHIGPLLPFARAFHAAGHDVQFAVRAPGAARIERAGFPVRRLADAPAGPRDAAFARAIGRSTDDANGHVFADVFLGMDARAALPGVLDAIEAWRPDVIVSESTEVAGPVAAASVGLRAVRIGICQGGVEDRVIREQASAADALRADAGLAPDVHAARLRALPYLSAIPAALEDPATPPPPHTRRYRTPHQPRPLPVQAWFPGDARPLVYLTYGSVAPGAGFFPGLFRESIDALAGLDVRVLVTIGEECDPADLGPLPAGVHAERWVPQADVLADAAVVVSHGGSGTVTGALQAGLPHVILPLFADQPYNAARVAALGAGIEVAAADELHAAVHTLLDDPRHRAIARGVQAEIAALPTMEAAVEVLHEITATIAAAA